LLRPRVRRNVPSIRADADNPAPAQAAQRLRHDFVRLHPHGWRHVSRINPLARVELRAGVAGAERLHHDAGAAQLQRQSLAEADEVCFAGGVVHTAGRSDEARDRRDVDYRAFIARPHRRQRRTGQPHGRGAMDGYYLLHSSGVGLPELAARIETGVVDQQR
jgi:hypothetical protein